jgi:hypothetical protein
VLTSTRVVAKVEGSPHTRATGNPMVDYLLGELHKEQR